MASDPKQNEAHDLATNHPPVAPPAEGRAGAAAHIPQPDSGLAEHGVREGAGELGSASGATRAPAGATRFFETAQGRLSHTQLAERLSEPLLALDHRIRRGEFAAQALDETLLLKFHAALSRELFPETAGRYRSSNVRVSEHEAPAAPLVPQRIRDYVLNLEARMRHLSGEADDLLLEFLAYAEGELLTIHPFADLNGRMSRLWLTEILRRSNLPPVDLVPPAKAFRDRYLALLPRGTGGTGNP